MAGDRYSSPRNVGFIDVDTYPSSGTPVGPALSYSLELPGPPPEATDWRVSQWLTIVPHHRENYHEGAHP